ncbi:MAG: hypothetical protein K6V97_14810 [Actinomycetia bacterium]|nr:hypothetical protein [Actinomycetes bacterium]
MTLQLLWQAYRAQPPDGYQYSRCCERYRQHLKTLDVVLRKTYRPGEYRFVDYAGATVPIIHPKTGVVPAAQVFVAVLGYRNYFRTPSSPDDGVVDHGACLYPRILRRRA